jgi:hypothetical protein
MLNKYWARWKKFGRVLGDYVARAFLTIFYFSIALPFGLLMRFSRDPLNRRPKTTTNWTTRDPQEQNLEDARRSF